MRKIYFLVGLNVILSPLYAQFGPNDDLDGDGILNINDIDADNDGILNAIESPECFYTSSEWFSGDRTDIQVTTGLSMNATYNAPNELVDGNNGNASTSYAVRFTASAVGLSPVTVYQFEMPDSVQLDTVFLGYINTSTHFAANTVLKLQGSQDGSSWTDLNNGLTYSTTTATNGVTTVPGVSGTHNSNYFPVTQNAGKYKYYRIYWTGGGSITATGISNEAYFSTNTNYVTSANLKTTCNSDIDDDGIPNYLDLDSDGDGCYDSYEAGVTNATYNGSVTDSITAGPYGGNGLADDLQNLSPDTNTVSYASTYYNYAIYRKASLCVDTDGDGIPDLMDIDDDNDGIIDTDEMEACSETLLKPTSADFVHYWVNTNSSINKTLEENVTMATTFGTAPYGTNTALVTNSWYSGAQNGTGNSYALKPFEANLSYNFSTSINTDRVVLWNPDANNYGGEDQGIKDFNIIVTLEDGTIDTFYNYQATISDVAQTFTFPYTETNVVNVTLQVTDGWYGNAAPSITSARAQYDAGTMATNYNMTLREFRVACAPVDKDTDGNGIPDRLDLDSDGDGCPDALEGGMGFGTGDVLNDTLIGGVDSLGVPLVTNGGQSLGSSEDSTTISQECKCSAMYSDNLDTDGDGITDICDLDDDNDGVLDTEEGCTTHVNLKDSIRPTSQGPVTMLMYSNNTFLVADNNFNMVRIVNTPSTDISQITNSGVTITQTAPKSMQVNNITATSLADAQTKGEYIQFSFTTDGNAYGAFIDYVGFLNRINQVGFSVTFSISDDNFATHTDLATFNELSGDGLLGSEVGRENEDITDYQLALNTTYTVRIYFYGLTSGTLIDFDDLYLIFGACYVDTDKDGIPNYLDLDSDNDGCPDAAEASVPNMITSNDSIVEGPYGANGLADTVQSAAPDTNKTNYTSTYSTYALDSGVANCTFLLPIELLSFNTVLENDNTVLCSWITATEVNNDYFTIEHSKDAIAWETVVTVKGAGNSREKIVYMEHDYHPYTGISYYRMKQTDFDGKYSYSQIESVNITSSDFNLTNIYPNPAENYVVIANNKTEIVSLKITDALGRDISTNINYIEKDTNYSKLDISNLDFGIYYFIINDEKFIVIKN